MLHSFLTFLPIYLPFARKLLSDYKYKLLRSTLYRQLSVVVVVLVAVGNFD